MPNVQHPGFLPTRLKSGGGTISYARKRVLTNNTNAIGLQDAVIVDTNGNVLGLGAATHATAVDGIAMGVSYVTSGERRGAKNLPAATLYTSSGVMPENASFVFITEDPVNTVLRCSVDAAVVLADLYANFSIVSIAPVNGLSGQELSGSSKNNTATLPIRALDFIIAPDNDVDAADAHLEATINVSVAISPALSTTGLA